MNVVSQLGVVLALLCVAGSTVAQPAAEPPPPPCSQPRSAIDTIVRAVAQSLAPIPKGTLVVAAPLESDEPAPRRRELAARLAELLAGRLGMSVSAAAEPRERRAAEATLGTAPAWIWLRAQVSRGALHLSADLHPVPSTIWARARAPKPGPAAHGYSAAPIDGEVRSYLRPISFDAPKVAKFASDEAEIVALACGDLDADGGSELVTIGRQRITSVALVDGQVRRLQELRWSDQVPIAPVPLRQPIGLAAIVAAAHSPDGEPYLDVSSTDRAASLRLGRGLRILGTSPGVAVPVGSQSGCTERDGLELGVSLQRCRPGDPPLSFDGLGRRSDAMASTIVVDGHGRSTPWLAIRAAQQLRLRSARGAELRGGRVGAQLALADLDQDGAPEVVTTMDVLEASHDAIVVQTVAADGSLRPRFRVPVPTGVQAVAACPPDGPGPAPLVVATRGQLWVVR